MREADARVPELAGDLFATEDLKGAVRSFLEHGPGPRDLRGPLRGLLHRRVPAAGAVMIPRMRGLAGISPRAPQPPRRAAPPCSRWPPPRPRPSTPSPTVVKDPKDAVAGAPDLTRAQIGLASDRRVRFALTLAAPWQPKDLSRAEGPPGSLCVRLWTVTKPGATPPDYLVCATARADGETMRGTVFKTQPGEQLAKRRGRDRRAHERPHDDPALLADPRRTAEDDRLHRRGDQARMHARLVRRHGARSPQDRHLPAPRKLLGRPARAKPLHRERVAWP